MQHVKSIHALGSTIKLLRVTIGIIYIWFGILKFFPGLSPAEELAKETINLLTFGLIPRNVSIIILAIWETGVGIAMIGGVRKSYLFWLILVHMACTFAPLFLLSGDSFSDPPFALTLVGQYIIKNLVIVSALLVVREFDRKN